MRHLPLKLAGPGGVAAFLVALPALIDASRSNATALDHATSSGSNLNATSPKPRRPSGTPVSVAGVARRLSRRAVRRH